MKHATAAALAQLSDLLAQIRTRPVLKEKKLGIFYVKSKSFLHFHEDQAGLFADVSDAHGFDRYPCNTEAQGAALLAAIDKILK